MLRSSRLLRGATVLSVIAALAGCHSLRREKVPPERPYMMSPTETGAATAPPVGFSSEPPVGAFNAVPAQSAAPAADALPGMPGIGSPAPMTPAAEQPGVMGQAGAPPSPL